MCGIVGARHDWLVQQGLDPEAAMRGAVASLAWRGPDGQGVVRAGAWWLGCARLAIGPRNSRQPLVRRGGRFACVMNGAITNARELWARLRPGVEQRPLLPNDAWLPLLALEHGNDAPLWHMFGHHAYAVADAQTGKLVLGRDRHGEKPLLCLVERVGGAATLVAFASTPVALQRLGMPAPRSAAWLGEWFRFGWAAERTHRLDSRRRLTTLWWPGPHTASGPGRAWFDPRPIDAARQGLRVAPCSLREALCSSVARCADTRVPVALSLSGGLDSSCLAVALHANGHRVPAYQLRTTGSPAREREAAAAVASRTQLELRPVDVGIATLDALPFLTACAGMPLGDPSVLAVHALARVAAADGIRVLLGGEGADELLLGYRRYRALASLPARMRWLRRLVPQWSMRYLARWLRAVTANDPIGALLAVTPPAFGDVVLARGLAAPRCWRDDEHHLRPPLQAVVGAVSAANGGLEHVARTQDLYGYLRCDLLPKVDVATMAAGIEARCPFLETDFPPAAQRRLGKRALREAFAADLPPEVLRLRKTGFALPLDRWFRGELPWLDLLREPATCQRPHLRPGGIARAIDLHRSGNVELGHGLYLLVACELFLRAFPEGNPASVRTTTGPRA